MANKQETISRLEDLIEQREDMSKDMLYLEVGRAFANMDTVYFTHEEYDKMIDCINRLEIPTYREYVAERALEGNPVTASNYHQIIEQGEIAGFIDLANQLKYGFDDANRNLSFVAGEYGFSARLVESVEEKIQSANMDSGILVETEEYSTASELCDNIGYNFAPVNNAFQEIASLDNLIAIEYDTIDSSFGAAKLYFKNGVEVIIEREQADSSMVDGCLYTVSAIVSHEGEDVVVDSKGFSSEEIANGEMSRYIENAATDEYYKEAQETIIAAVNEDGFEL